MTSAGPLLAGAALALAAATPLPAVAGPAAVRAITLNLLHGGPLSELRGDDQDLDRRLELVAAELEALRPDVVGLQEASVGRKRGDVAERLAGRLGLYVVRTTALMHWFPYPDLNRLARWLLGFAEGPAILSRYPIRRWEIHALPRCGRPLDPRALIYAELDTPWGALSVFSTHTSNDACHTRRVAELVRDRRAELPALLMGDFNAVEDAPPITALTREAGFVDVFRAANPGATGATVWQRVQVAEATVRRRVDYVFLLAGTAAPGRVLASRVVLDRPGQRTDGRPLWPSDHYGVLAEVALE
jgi:endonuclease/exonuclease/phosphatase family metal-dependent hydrolase